MRVLVVKTSSLGDIIHTLPALTDASNNLPGIRFDWVVEEAFSAIPTWHPQVDTIIPVAIRRWRKYLFTLIRSGEWQQYKSTLQKYHYDAVIDAQGLLKSAFLVTHLARGKRFGPDRHSARESLAAKFYDQPLLIPKNQHAVERIRQLFAQTLDYSLPASKGNFGLQQYFATLVSNQPDTVDYPYVMFLHGTSRTHKEYPENSWSQLAERINAAGLQIKIPWGNQREYQRAQRIASTDSKRITVLPQLTLQQLAIMLYQSTAVVTVDSGLGHLAAALDVPAVSLYGPTSPQLIGSYGNNQIHLAAEKSVDKLAKSQAKASVVRFVSADKVWQILKKLLNV